jgi:hypothetical protein
MDIAEYVARNPSRSSSATTLMPTAWTLNLAKQRSCGIQHKLGNLWFCSVHRVMSTWTWAGKRKSLDTRMARTSFVYTLYCQAHSVVKRIVDQRRATHSVGLLRAAFRPGRTSVPCGPYCGTGTNWWRRPVNTCSTCTTPLCDSSGKCMRAVRIGFTSHALCVPGRGKSSFCDNFWTLPTRDYHWICTGLFGSCSGRPRFSKTFAPFSSAGVCFRAAILR